MRKFLSAAESVCPECLTRIQAIRVQVDHDIYLEKKCPQHGAFRTIIWRGKPAITSWAKPKIPSYPKETAIRVEKGCPFDCGLCEDHRQHTCSVLFEITQRCDLHCPVCFAAAGTAQTPDWTMDEIEAWYRLMSKTVERANIQLSGGEPCMRDDLPEIIRMGKSYGFTFFQVNTNGLRLARDPAYLEKLKEAGLSAIFLQFDGTHDNVYRKLRGRDLLVEKLALIDRCAEVEIGVILVPTLVPGVNTDQIGAIIRLALEHMPTVRGVHFQPVSYFGRYPTEPSDESRFTIPDVIRAIEEQMEGNIAVSSFCPPGCENAVCSFHANFVLMPNGDLKAITHHTENACCSTPIQAEEGAARARAFVAENWSSPETPAESRCGCTVSLDELDDFLTRKRTHMFCISGMAFQDAWTMDLARLRDCCIHVASPDGRLIPFCAYNLTDRHGHALYRKSHETHPA
jgi:hypothetical protein